jgi:hypothetical protein
MNMCGSLMYEEYEDKCLVLRQQVILNHRYIHVFTRLHGVMFLKTVIFIVMLISC